MFDFAVPPAIQLSHSNGNRFLNIQLEKGFQHQKQTDTSIVLRTPGLTDAIPQTYGFRFLDGKSAQMFSDTLGNLATYSDRMPLSALEPTNSPHNISLNPYATWHVPRNSHNFQSTGARPKDDNVGVTHSEDFMADVPFNNERIPTEEEFLCMDLSEKIDAGNLDEAENLIVKLTEKKSTLMFTPQIPKKNEFKILIRIEDKNNTASGTVRSETFDPHNTSIAMLKYHMFQKYQFPMEKQIWIIGKSFGKDELTLAQCGVKATGTTIFLYLRSDQKTGRKPVKYQEEMIQTEESITMFWTHSKNKKNETEFGGSHTEGKEGRGNLGAANALARNPANEVQERLGWDCPKCTYRNLPTFEGCTICTEPRPADYEVPENYVMLPEEVERLAIEKRNEELLLQLENERREEEQLVAQNNYQHMMQVWDQRLLPNQEDFDCSICMDDVAQGEGVMLRDCLHLFCKECLIGTITNSEDPEVRCPHNDGFACPAIITMQEIEELLPHEEYGKYLSKSLHTAERGAKDSFHCRSANCAGWCFYEDDVNNFICPICGRNNCLTCKAIHPDQTCKDYQDDLRIRAENDDAAKKTQAVLDELINKGEAMYCPQCKVILQKKQGCDWMRCTMCRCEICWATKGPRWGPNGNGDTSGGCRCGVNGRCTPNCGNCH